MIAFAACLGLLLFQGEEIPRLIEQLKSDQVEVRDAAAKKLIEAGEPAKKAVEELAAGTDLETSARAKGILRRIDARAQVKGRKVLVSFHGYPVGKFGGPDNTEAHDQAAKDILAALAKAEVKVLQVLSDTRQSTRRSVDPKQGAVHFEQMILVDCGKRDPEEALAGLPHRGGAIVFDDGAYAKGIANADKRFGEGLPARYAFMFWGVFENKLKETDLARYRSQRGVAVEFTPPPPSSGGSAGVVKLTPEPGVTLLEVFLLTRAGFHYIKGE